MGERTPAPFTGPAAGGSLLTKSRYSRSIGTKALSLFLAVAFATPATVIAQSPSQEGCSCPNPAATTVGSASEGYQLESSGETSPGVYRRVFASQGQSTRRIEETLIGNAAWEHLNKVRRNRDASNAINRAREQMVRRGYEPTDALLVSRVYEEDPSGRVSKQDASASNSSGEIVVWSSDDGNDNTWEGTMYIERYSTGKWKVFNAQVRITDAGNHPKRKWEDFIDRGFNGAGGGGPYPVSLEGRDAPGYRTVIVSEAIGATIVQSDDDEERAFRQFVACMAAAAAFTATGCLGTGFFYFACFFSIHSIASVWCALNQFAI